MLKQFVKYAFIVTLICKVASSAFPFCGSGESPCYTRYNGPNGPEGVCYNPSKQSCWPLGNGESVVCSFGEHPCGKQCYKIGGGKTCWSYNTLCDQKHSACIMSELQKGQCYDFFKETCFPKVVCARYQVPCPNDNTKCCAAGK